MRDVERGAFDRLLRMRKVVVDQFVALRGNGDRGERVATDAGWTLRRSVKPIEQKLPTIFGEHAFAVHVYRERRHPNTPIELRPVEARMALSLGRWSDLLEEFTQLFCIEDSFDAAEDAFERIFGQRLSRIIQDAGIFRASGCVGRVE